MRRGSLIMPAAIGASVLVHGVLLLMASPLPKHMPHAETPPIVIGVQLQAITARPRMAPPSAPFAEKRRAVKTPDIQVEDGREVPVSTEALGSPSSAVEPGQAGPGPVEVDARAIYYQRIRLQIEAAKAYPRTARLKGQVAQVLVRFTLNRQGGIVSGPFIEQGSNYPLLNQAALQAIHGGSPYPPFGNEFGLDTLSFVVPLKFELRR